MALPEAEAPSGKIVEAHDLCRRYGEGEAAVDALAGVTVDFPAGRFTAIMGPSGSGKSTLMHILAGLDRPTSGTVSIAGVQLTDLSDRELTQLRRDRVGFIFQTFNLLPVLNAEENILLPLSIAGRDPDREWFDRLIDTVGIRDRLTHRPAEMSGGQQQRVAVARALISKPSVVFADEPSGNLDSTYSSSGHNATRARSTRLNLAASLQLVLPIGDHDFAGIESSSDNRRVSLCEGHSNWAILHRLIGIDCVHERPLRAPQNRRSRDNCAVFSGFEQQVGVYELVRPQLVVFVVKNGLKLRRARRRINLVVNRQQFAGRQFRLIVAAEGIDLQRPLLHMLRYVREHVFRQREDHGDRLQLRQDQHGIRIGGVNDVAGIDLPQSNPPVERRGNVAIHNIELGRFDLRQVGAYRALELVG